MKSEGFIDSSTGFFPSMYLVRIKLSKLFKRILVTVFILIWCFNVPKAFVSSRASNHSSAKCGRFDKTQATLEIVLFVVHCVRETNSNTNYTYTCSVCGIRVIDGFAHTMSGIRVIGYSSDKGNNCIKICGQRCGPT